MGFQKAEKTALPLKCLLGGASGSGKTYTALQLATAICADSGRRIAVLDTEAGSANLYADEFDFDSDSDFRSPTTGKVCYDPRIYMTKLKQAVADDYGCVIIDSLSHEWEGPGGLLSLIDTETEKIHKGDNKEIWRRAGPLQDRFLTAILECPIPIIATVRMRTREFSKAENIPVNRMEFEPIFRDGMKIFYDFLLGFVLDREHRIHVAKSRYGKLDSMGPEIVTPELAAHIAETVKGDK